MKRTENAVFQSAGMPHLALKACVPIPAMSLLLALATTGRPACADQRTEPLPITAALGFETVRLPGGERMGLVGGALLFDIGSDWSFGPAVSGAATGRRGGLFVGGVELQRRWRLGQGFGLGTGLYAGGGGGAAAPVGSGLMLRPAVTLWKDIGPVLQAGLSWSSVRFPSGQIASQQLGLVLAWRGEFAQVPGGGSGDSGAWRTGLGFDRIAATATGYQLTDGSARHIGLAGARAEQLRDTGIGSRSAWGIEAAAAAKGDAAGYMEILGTASIDTAPFASALPAWRVGVRLGAGLAGGGSVPTGGGVVGKASLTTSLRVAPSITLGADYGVVDGLRSPLRARQAQVWLGIALEPRGDGVDGRGVRNSGAADVPCTEWVGAVQHHARVRRSDGTREALDTIGLKLNRCLGEHLYISGQAHSAFAGGAGAYSVGLVGAGLVVHPAEHWRLGTELLVGAAGGGGVATSGGALAQGMAWGAWVPNQVSEWRAGAGVARPLRGGNASPVFELAWSRTFGPAGR